MAPFDEILKKDAETAALLFARKLLDASDDVVSFVDRRLSWGGVGEFDGLLAGSFNISLKVKRGHSDQRVIIRFPLPGKSYGPWGEEKVKNEALTMTYIRKHTHIPTPTVYCWGGTEESPQALGPFMVMDFVKGENLGRFLAEPTDDKSKLVFLNPQISEKTLDNIYEQIAEFILELSRLEFPRIGAIGMDDKTAEWTVAERPLTYDMNEVVTVGGCSAEEISITTPFDQTEDFFGACARYFQTHLEGQRNISGGDDDVAWKQFVARRCFAKLIPKFGMIENAGPFRLFCDDLRPTNMLIDPETLRIVAVFDFEFTNAMPAQFVYDVPWWLLLQPPAVWLRQNKLEEFLRLFEPRKDQFIRSMERAEAKMSSQTQQLPLSTRMRDSWNSGRFWFNLASRCSFDVDDFYWQTLHEEGMGEDLLECGILSEKESFLSRKGDQFNLYWSEKERDQRFTT
ncbi:kinase-like domain protein [Fusarium beomiforme]|uniref:Kinase-like domain protein n=1 Tax=Fusarium beomiforme TaxID=44412 RepID=A0A9P5AI85_9HYPO|nr:kinase-like domain protein [Fusarium beomiforme]